jgi:hypothetical protein
VLLLSGLKLVNVPTLAIGVVLLVCVVALLGAWITIRVSGRTLRDIVGETSRNAGAAGTLALDAEGA